MADEEDFPEVNGTPKGGQTVLAVCVILAFFAAVLIWAGVNGWH